MLHHTKRYEGHQAIHDIISFDGGSRHAIGLHDRGDGGQVCLYRMCSVFIFLLRVRLQSFSCVFCEGCIAFEAACRRQLFFVRYASERIQGTCKPPLCTCERAACLLMQIVCQILPDLIRFPIWINIFVDDVEFLTARMLENCHLLASSFFFLSGKDV